MPARAGEASPLWFGPPERPLQGWMHRPPHGRARGAVVLCPPIGAELNSSQFALRVLARKLAAAGFLVLRFDYDGTGQSAGDFNDRDRVAGWTASISAAVDLVRAWGAQWVAGVGLRLGATLLARAAAEGVPLAALVLWDPHVSGRVFLREEMAMRLAVPGAGPDRDGEIPGHVLTEATVGELMSLELPAEPAPPGARVLALVDPARPQTARLRRRLAGEGIEWQEHSEPGTVFDNGATQFDLPEGILAQPAAWLDGACDAAAAPVRAGRGRPPAAVVGRTSDGGTIVEELMCVAPFGLFGVACQAPEVPSRGPVLMFLTTGAESSIGPGRLWVELAREWAAVGFRSVRFDVSGIGESRPREGEPEREIYSPFAVEDVAVMACAASPQDPGDVVLIGVSSGGHFGLAAGALLRCRGVVSINAVLDERPTARRAAAGAQAGRGRSARQGLARGRESLRGLARAMGPWLAPLAAGLPRGHNLRRRLLNRVPPLVWSLLYVARPERSPARLIVALIDAGVPTVMLSGNWESELPLLRTPSAVRRLQHSGHSDFIVAGELDHSLMNAASRDLARDTIARFVRAIAVTPSAAVPAPAMTAAKEAASGSSERRPFRVGWP